MSRGYQALALLLITMALIFGGYRWGAHATNNAWEVKQAKAEREQAAKYQAEVARGDRTAAAYLTQHLDQEDRYEKLDDQFKALRKRVPLTLPARVAQGHPAAGPDAIADQGANSAGGLKLPADAGVPRLTLGAVWMWNSALAGRDLPAGACGAAAAAAGAQAACAADAGLDLDDAWANQKENARSCADDRKRLSSLIEFIKGGTP
jgi:hypothetical protein